MKYSYNILVNKSGAKVLLCFPPVCDLPVWNKIKNILLNKSGEKVLFCCASLQFTSIRYSYNILVNKLGEKVNFVFRKFVIYRYEKSWNILVNKSGEKLNYLFARFSIYQYTAMKIEFTEIICTLTSKDFCKKKCY